MSFLSRLVPILAGLLATKAQLQCEQDLWPVFAGATDQSEKTTCIVYDKTNELIIVGGTSEDQTPNSNYPKAGFLYALDLNGNWQWGGNVFHVVQLLSEITACSMNSDQSALTIFGINEDMPVIVELDTMTTNVQKFIQLQVELTEIEVVFPSAIFSDKQDETTHLFASFLIGMRPQLVKIITNEPDTPLVNWSFEI